MFCKRFKGGIRMPFVPAVCNDCHTIFSSGLYVRDIDMNVSGYEVRERCTNCNGEGQVLSGIYKFIDYTIAIIKETERPLSQLKKLHQFLTIVYNYNIGYDEVEFDIYLELPTFADILLLLPETKKDYKLCLHILIQVVSAIIEISIQADNMSSRAGGVIKIHQDLKSTQIVDQIYTQNTGVKRRLF